MNKSLDERMLGVIGAASAMLLLGYVLVFGLAITVPRVPGDVMALMTIGAPPVPPPPLKPRLRKTLHDAPANRADARPEAKRASAVVPASTPQVLSTPVASLIPSPVVAVVAPLSEAGGALSGGDGSGSGGGGGAGGGGTGDGDGDAPPRLISGRLGFADLPADMRAAGVGGTVAVRYDVEIDGRVGDCEATGSSGNPELDLRTCQLIRQRFHFRPSRDRQGRPVRSTIEEEHSWAIDKIAVDKKAAAGPSGQ